MPLVDLGKNLLEAARLGQIEAVQILLYNGALFTTDLVRLTLIMNETFIERPESTLLLQTIQVLC